MNNIATIKHYHETTKHRFGRYARSLGYLDWATQPDPFREFTGAERIALPKTDEGRQGEEVFSGDALEDILYEELFIPGRVPPQRLSRETLGIFFEYSLAISAWKRVDRSQWALRINPSSGNLHPTEGYCLLPAMDEIHTHPGVYHYAPREHSLEKRGEFPQAVWDILPPDIFLVGLSSISWRETWKYGERAFRYCQHDCGHAYMALDMAARLLGWRIGLPDTISDREIGMALGLDRTDEFQTNEGEIPELLITVQLKPNGLPTHHAIPERFFQGVSDGAWFGKAAPFRRAHHDWPLIHTAERATGKPRTAPGMIDPSAEDDPFQYWQSPYEQGHYERGFSARQVIKKRRSAVGMDGTSALGRASFYRMLSRIAGASKDLPWQPKVHLALFVHRVDDLVPGLYLLVRHPAMRAELEKATHDHFRWESPPASPAGLPLYFLREGDLTHIARTISCTQDIASDGAFSVGMVARFQSELDAHGAWFYKRLFWETGMIGQLLYLEAEAVGLSGCGIGCFFDDAVHELLGFRDRAFQSLYHFTVGGAVPDSRLAS
uniref:SagB-type dehydrogenase domain-containing protein n=1 Tax=Candidatus Kentrum eta TaxID=2126337 RepID=A0A450V0C5_9GAMM|nr:MAG: SagB-type dehydrogenase domain-containing protein [Candidatus Kentron sp. H]VFJ98243.1 MAG: SagB-type dehydrogenase domain-containing protein [Candidatus Kentron sp. H]VFK03256.1 MAG: SagB-type dehydrogenase domain-containing protein [Candidatus Kentron sp. H]